MIGVMSFISVVLLAGVLYFFTRKNIKNRPAILGLALKLLSGILLGFIYKYHYDGGDTFQYFEEASLIVNFIKIHPDKFFDVIFNASQIPELTKHLAYADQPRALFFTKIIIPLFFFSGGHYWILSLILSLLNFFAVFLFVNELIRTYPDLKMESTISFYFLPTFVFWTSGVLKESLAIAAFLILFTIGLKMIRTQKYFNFSYVLGLILAAILLWQLKYYYAAVAIPVLATWLGYYYVSKYIKRSIYLLPLLLFFCLLAVSFLHYNLGFTRILSVVYQNYQVGIEQSAGDAIHYYRMDGTLMSFLINSPVAVFSGFYRPLLFEVSGLFAVMVSIENTAVLLLSSVALWKSRLMFKVTEPTLLLLIIYIIILAVFLAFSTPNFGTLSRFKVAYWPFLVLLVLSCNKKSQTFA